MRAITEILTDIVSEAFEKCGYDRSLGCVTEADRPDLCQFQCNGAFGGAKLYHKPPFSIAEQVARELAQDSRFSRTEAMKPGFINLVVSDEYLVEYVNSIANDPYLGIPQICRGKRAVIDYGGPNVAKPLHIGHLRSAIIGESIKRLARACGCTVYGDIHLGDWGLQIGLVITELRVRHPEWKCFSEDFDAEKDSVEPLDIDLLNEVYPYASAKSKTDEEYSRAAHKATYELQNGRPGYIALWREILRVSVADLKANYDKLGVTFDCWYGESDAAAYEPELMRILTSKGLLRESEGAQVVDVAEPDDTFPIPPVIIKKSDNSSIYATTDLATIIQRVRDFSPDAIWYVVDNRQSLHFTQVFRCARRAGLVCEDTELGFFGFGTMNGSDGKPYKTRDGGVMRLSDLIEAVTSAAREKLEGSSFVSQADREQTSRRVGVAALKFGDLMNYRAKDYIFDMDKFLSFEGKTGTYLLYTVTRINSILKKAGVSEDACLPVSGVYSEADRELLLCAALCGKAYVRAYEEKAPNYLCDSAYAIASSFSHFYHENRILDQQDPVKRESWLALISLVRRLLIKNLDILGIETVENM